MSQESPSPRRRPWTEGPWYDDFSGNIKSATEVYTDGLPGEKVNVICLIGAMGGQTGPDSRLIAAAPDLYEALENLIRRFEGPRMKSMDRMALGTARLALNAANPARKEQNMDRCEMLVLDNYRQALKKAELLHQTLGVSEENARCWIDRLETSNPGFRVIVMRMKDGMMSSAFVPDQNEKEAKS